MPGSDAPRIEAIGTALPPLDFERDYRRWATARLGQGRAGRLYERMAQRSGIDHRWSVLSPEDARLADGIGLYGQADPPTTATRMAIYAEAAPELALQAIADLPDIAGITHLVVASCTGFVAPGIDQIVARRLGLAATVERVLVGFMGCYAAVTALRTARHIARSDRRARVLVVTVELSTLHHQDAIDLEPMLAGAQFGDGAAAALVTGADAATGPGLALGDGLSAALEDSADLITWRIGDTGFHMRLSGEVPGRIAAALADDAVRDAITGSRSPAAIAAWAVHAGGRSILDAVENGLGLDRGALADSRAVLRDCGNMSSATLMFVLQRLMRARPASGVALAFGPGLAMEGFRFGWTDGADDAD